MMHYKKGKNVEEELRKDNIPIECLPKDFLWMHVKGGTTVSNVIDYAKKALDNGEYRDIVWTGSGGGVTKTISCAEILKRHYFLHQVTRICNRKVEEYWDPLMEGLEQIVVTREIPCVHIYLSLNEIDSKTPGYQNSKSKVPVWDQMKNKQKNNDNNKCHYGQSSRSGNENRRQQNQHYKRRKPKKDKQHSTTQTSKPQKETVPET